MKKLIAMIPARLGSKRIPQKNIRYLYEKPLLQYAIDLALSSKCFDEVWVNSESDIIGNLALSCGARFHKRPDELSSDTATNQQFTAEFLYKHPCDYLIMLNSTSPLLRVDTIKKFYDFVRKNNYDTVFSVIDEYAECFFDDKAINFSLERKVNSQDLKPVRKIVWALTAWRREPFLEADSKNLCGTYFGKVGLFSIPKDEAVDLDTPEDWAIAEAHLLARKNKNTKEKYWMI
ncbi:acylneuraminate cytidylyltransferase family protein [Anaeromicrobium sediminis]|uniref:Cytidyltransferase n=1 Tax=Anaeromicrobium sediminis TaxID=1478221 RepID=A0A267MJQ5_9FIRM|nr:acylneuraminate cytidylyltransferase family protein [Anaeromicrobium sediminis]PAB59148.1 hypothetical protein CCE28_11560 [Anaeromicrobium sediminis]